MNKYLHCLFEELNKENISYVVLRDGYNILYEQIRKDKDLDILVKLEDKNRFFNLMAKLGFKNIGRNGWYHPSYRFLYSVEEFNQFVSGDLKLDIRYQLVCRSVNWHDWIPLDKIIQTSVWNNKIKINNYYVLCNEDLIIYLLTHGVFDKLGHFEDSYVAQIKKAYDSLDDKSFLKKKLNLVFFCFTDEVIKHIECDNLQNLRNDYLKFKEY